MKEGMNGKNKTGQDIRENWFLNFDCCNTFRIGGEDRTMEKIGFPDLGTPPRFVDVKLSLYNYIGIPIIYESI